MLSCFLVFLCFIFFPVIYVGVGVGGGVGGGGGGGVGVGVGVGGVGVGVFVDSAFCVYFHPFPPRLLTIEYKTHLPPFLAKTTGRRVSSRTCRLCA